MSTTAVPVSPPVGYQADPEPPTDEEPRRRHTRAIIAGAIALVIAAIAAFGVWWFFIRSDDPAESATAEPQVVEVSTATFGEVVSADGTVATAETEDLSFGSAGTVTAVNVAAGDTVSAGQVLATIDSAELESDLADAEAEHADAVAALEEAQDSGAADEQIEAREAAVVTAQDAVDLGVEALEGAQLVATIDGLVTTVDLRVGEELGSSGVGGTTVTGSATGSGQSASQFGSAGSGAEAPGGGATSDNSSSTTASEPQIQIVSQGRFVVELGVDTADIQKIEVGQQAELSISTDSSGSGAQFPTPPGGAFPGGGFPAGGPSGAAEDSGDSDSADETAADITATGSVTEVSGVADASSGVATYAVTVSFTDDSGEVWAGSTATADISVSARKDVIQVNSNAVAIEDGTSTVTVALDGTAEGSTEIREVRTGDTQAGMVEIVSGLEPGEMVIVQGRTFGGGFGGQLPEGVDPASGGGPPGGEMPERFEPPTGAEAGS